MVDLSRIYTKSGDAGETGLGDGNRVPKDHPRVAAYGAVDELNACLGMLVSLPAAPPEIALLKTIQNDLLDLGGDLCVPLAADEAPGARLRIQPAQIIPFEAAEPPRGWSRSRMVDGNMPINGFRPRFGSRGSGRWREPVRRRGCGCPSPTKPAPARAKEHSRECKHGTDHQPDGEAVLRRVAG